MSLYTELRDSGTEIDCHESDLYVPRTAENLTILARYPLQRGNAVTFTSQIDGKLWLDIPFAYDPWWEARNVKNH